MFKPVFRIVIDLKVVFIFSVYRKILQILTAKPGERYAGEDIVLPEFESLPLPEEFLHARDQKLLPVYVMPEEAEEIYKVFKFISANFKVTSICKSMFGCRLI